MEMLDLFLREHAMVHGLEVGDAEGKFSLEYNRVHGLSDEQLRIRPNGWNSIAWLLWHTARSEDVAVNVIVSDRPQVFDEGDWARRLNVARRDIGTGMTDEEVADLSSTINIPNLREYRRVVGQRTQEVARALPTAEWDRIPDAATTLERATAQGVFIPEAAWVGRLWEGKSKAWFLYWVAVGHNSMHMGQAGWVKEMILQKRGR